MTKDTFIKTLNQWGRDRNPFLFIADFEMEKPVAIPLTDVSPVEILYDIEGFTNAKANRPGYTPHVVTREPISFEEYKNKFDIVFAHLAYGDSYLTNLTTKTRIQLSHSLADIFYSSNALYKLWYRDEFLVFSPESFVKIHDGKIFSYPMKGTIDASIPGAASKILNDKKELAEHVTIVDLIRNDLSRIARGVNVKRFRYIDEIRTSHTNLFQVSSEISGQLANGFESSLGDILHALLPAGSITGAPKEKTVSIIQSAERDKRGYYTGVFGYFDGVVLNSGVMIRYIEKQGDLLFYRSGGGITTQSDPAAEYSETIQKVYVPVD
jgi:para-aminobenzoate synthetase component I